jgi:hypothetical protein
LCIGGPFDHEVKELEINPAARVIEFPVATIPRTYIFSDGSEPAPNYVFDRVKYKVVRMVERDRLYTILVRDDYPETGVLGRLFSHYAKGAR